jgi:predicted AlkP superfamily phosphohydrolase/phosphomutase
MKLLIIGIDGGTKEIIEGMPMPFTQSLLRDSYSKEIDEDLLSRGWAEILTGEHASSNKAFYLMPFADGSYDFSGSYSKRDMVSASSHKPLWQVLSDLNVLSGIVNVPTTGPAEKINGFMVAGGGGGIQAKDGIPDGMVYPPEYKKKLEEKGYVFDVRLPGGESTVSGFLKKIKEAERIQRETFVELSKLNNPDFGFHCFRITTEVQYLARYEIEKCIEGILQAKKEVAEFVPDTDVQRNVIEHYRCLDDSIKSIFEELKPDNYILVGDHATELLQYEGNIDVWLSRNGFMVKMSKMKIFVGKLSRFIYRKICAFTSRQITPKSSLVRAPITKFSKNQTLAFGTFYDTGNFAGIYINDRGRFGGPVISNQESEEIVNAICEKFNADPAAARYGLEAKPYRKLFQGSDYQHLMPDIRIHKPDSIYFSSRNWDFIRINPNLKKLEEDISGVRYPHSGAKGSSPLLSMSKGLRKFIYNDDPKDLRLVYFLVCRFFSGVSK